jgi:hypothetical protein
MKLNRLLAILGMFSIMALLSVISCKKNISDTENNRTTTSQTSGLKQQGNPSTISAKGGSSPISQYFVIHSPNIIQEDGDPNPVDCYIGAFTDIYALRVDCNFGNVLYYMDFIKIETNWNSTNPSPNLIVTVNGNQLSHTATYVGGEANNHCLAYYQLQSVPSWELGVFDFCTPQTLNITYTDPVTNLSASETITVGLNGCYIGSYQTAAAVTAPHQISMALPFNSCICPGTSTIWPPSYTFRLEHPNGFMEDRTIPYVPYTFPPIAGYFAEQIFTGLTAPGTYKIWGKNNCPGVNTIFVPGIPSEFINP